ncbi:dimethylaniline monooxygenase [Penicillium malachiteum]|nr:dimethylaniline monooxygenase [Penicillium malachiteum]
MSDFPMPDEYPPHLTQAQFQSYMQSYAENFSLLPDIVFDAKLEQAYRNEEDSKWLLQLNINRKPQIEEYDKVAFTHGYQTKAKVVQFDGAEQFEGELIHAQEFKSPEQFRGQKIIAVEMGSTTSDIIDKLLLVASKVYVSHRRGTAIVSRWRGDKPTNLLVSWRRRQISQFLVRNFPKMMRWLSVAGTEWLMNSRWGRLDPEWNILPFPSPLLVLPSASESIIPALQNGSLTSLRGLRRFFGPRSVELTDGTIIDEVDAVICATGYTGDFTVAPFIQTSQPLGPEGPTVRLLWKNIFPPKYADSIAMLCYSAYGKNNGFSFCDVSSMAISNIWRGAHPLPSREQMEREIDEHHRWVISNWEMENTIDPSMVRSWDYQGFVHAAAGTGMENLGWGWKGWKFFFKDPKMSYLMNNGVETAHAFRYFETNKRKVWPGAREAIIHANEATNQISNSV